MEPPRKKYRTSKFNILDLEDDMLLEISSKCASSSLSSVRNLRLVCWKFKSICDNDYVLRSLSLEEEQFSPNWGDPRRIYIRYNKLRLLRNPTVLYRLGILAYFYDNRKDDGLMFLREASEGGFQEATYLYAIVLICIGEATKQQGFEFLSSFLLPLMSSTMRRFHSIRRDVSRHLTYDNSVISDFKTHYVREICNCDGSTTMFLYRSIAWHNYGEGEDIYSSSICRPCLWHYEVRQTLSREYD